MTVRPTQVYLSRLLSQYHNGVKEIGQPSLRSIARQVPIHPSTLRLWASGERPVGYQHLPRLADILNMTYAELLEQRDRSHVPPGQLTQPAVFERPRIEKLEAYTIGGWGPGKP